MIYKLLLPLIKLIKWFHNILYKFVFGKPILYSYFVHYQAQLNNDSSKAVLGSLIIHSPNLLTEAEDLNNLNKSVRKLAEITNNDGSDAVSNLIVKNIVYLGRK